MTGQPVVGPVVAHVLRRRRVGDRRRLPRRPPGPGGGRSAVLPVGLDLPYAGRHQRVALRLGLHGGPNSAVAVVPGGAWRGLHRSVGRQADDDERRYGARADQSWARFMRFDLLEISDGVCNKYRIPSPFGQMMKLAQICARGKGAARCLPRRGMQQASARASAMTHGCDVGPLCRRKPLGRRQGGQRAAKRWPGDPTAWSGPTRPTQMPATASTPTPRRPPDASSLSRS